MDYSDLNLDRRHRSSRHAVQGLLAAALLAASAPAAMAQAQAPSANANAAVAPIPDPWTGFNRGSYAFSMGVDGAVIAPVIHGYIRVTPHPIRTAISHAIDNLDEPRIAANDVLQGHLKHAGSASARFLMNSTIGLAGFIDVANQAGIPRHDSDFGQTLGRYGVGTGPYIFVPFVGPSDLRDGVGRIIDAVGDPVSWTLGGLKTTFGQVRDGVYVFQARVDIDDQLTGVRRDFTDPYATLRSAYSQNRQFKIQQTRGETVGGAAVDALPDFGAEPAPAAPPRP